MEDGLLETANLVQLAGGHPTSAPALLQELVDEICTFEPEPLRLHTPARDDTVQGRLGAFKGHFGQRMAPPPAGAFISDGLSERSAGHVYGRVVMPGSAGQASVEQEYPLLTVARGLTEELEDETREDSVATRVFVAIFRRLPSWCPSALVQFTLLVITSLCRNTPSAFAPGAEEERRPSHVTLQQLEELTVLVVQQMGQKEWVTSKIKEGGGGAATGDGVAVDDSAVAATLIRTFRNVLEELRGEAKQTRAAAAQTGIVSWLSAPMHRRVFEEAILAVLSDRARLERLLLLRDVPQPRRQEVLRHIVSEVLDWTTAKYACSSSRQEWWVLELLHWLIIRRARPQFAALSLFVLRLCHFKQPTREFMFARELQGLLNYLGAPRLARQQAAGSYVPRSFLSADRADWLQFFQQLATCEARPTGPKPTLVSSSFEFKTAGDRTRREVLVAFVGQARVQAHDEAGDAALGPRGALEPAVLAPVYPQTWQQRIADAPDPGALSD